MQLFVSAINDSLILNEKNRRVVFMAKFNMKQYLIIFITLMFVISMFYQFGKTGNENEIPAQANTTAGTAFATCRISAFASEVIVQPWNNQTMEIAKDLKAQGHLDYINTDGTKGFLILSQRSDLNEVRNAYIDSDATVLAQASCLISGMVNFTFANGTKSPQAPGVIRMYLDPFSQVGDEIDVDLIADIRESEIAYMVADPVSRTETASANATVQCTDYYAVVGAIDWENRGLNIAEASEAIGINESSIQYTRNDAVLFLPELNQTQINEIQDKMGAGEIDYITQIVAAGMLANSTDKQKIVDLISEYGIEPTFQKSQINVYVNSSEMLDAAKEYIGQNGELLSTQKGCLISLENTASAGSKQIYIPSDIRGIQYYVPVDSIPDDGNAIVAVSVETIGRIAQSLEFIGMQ